MQINRSGSDDTAARKRNLRTPKPRETGTKKTNRSAHRADKFIGQNRTFNVLGIHLHGVAYLVNLRAKTSQDLDHREDVGNLWDVLNDRSFPGQDRRRQNGQRGVLSAADYHGALEPFAALNDQFVHY